MDEQIKERLLSYMDTLEGAVESGSGFVVEQAPALAQELVMYRRAQTTMCCGFELAFAVGFLVVAMLVRKKAVAHLKANGGSSDDIECATFMPLIFGGFLSLMSLVLFAGDIADCLKAWFAPRLVILEEIAKLIN